MGKKFEYKNIPTIDSDENRLNALGQQGWDVVAYNSYRNFLIMKREIPESPAPRQSPQSERVYRPGDKGYEIDF